jgi:ATP-binding cassette, subfamily F, member 3
MNLLQLHQGSKHFGSKTLFQDARFSINDGEHVGVIGPNGAGKTTLFKILVGQESLDSGQLIKSQKLKIGYLEQEAREPLDLSAEDYLTQNCLKPIWELKQLGQELGLTESHFQVPFHQLSGGYRMRMKLLSLIGQEPNLMLLDEPTNFLDLESILALEKFLQSYKGAFLLISHDREFLRRTTDFTLEVESGEMTKFPGNIDDYFEQKAQLRQILEAQVANQDAKRKSVLEFVERFGAKATKAKQAQSRLKSLEKMEKIEIKDLPVRAQIKIPAPIHTGKETLSLIDASLGYEEKTVIENCDLRVEKGAHLGVVGFNGAGKSTLLKSIAGRLPLLQGERKLGYQVSLSYYAQHVTEELHADESVLESLQRAAQKDITAQEILNIAGSLLFSGDAIHKKVKVLSGGEKSRVALGQILLMRSPLLLMDEPTNHLDFDTVEALTEALRKYPGTVIVVSHDRGFIGRIATKILEIRDGRAEVYPGTYDDYVWSLEKGALKERYSASIEGNQNSQTPTKKSEKKSPSASQSNLKEKNPLSYRDETKKLVAEIRELQRKILKTEELLQLQNEKLVGINTELLAAKGPRAADLAKELSIVGEAIEKLEETLLEHMEKLEIADQRMEGRS